MNGQFDGNGGREVIAEYRVLRFEGVQYDEPYAVYEDLETNDLVGTSDTVLMASEGRTHSEALRHLADAIEERGSK